MHCSITMQLLLSSFYVGKRGERAQLTRKTKLMQSCCLYMHLLLVDPFQPNLSKEDRSQRYKIVKFCIKLHLGGRVGGEGSVHTSLSKLLGTVELASWKQQ